MEEPDRLEEERRLFYVGITRAERKLYLSFAESRRRNGQVMPSLRSRFLDDIPQGLLDERRTIKVRASGRMSFTRDSGLRDPARDSMFGQTAWRGGSSRRAHEVPAWRVSPKPVDEAEPTYAKGERINHKLFGGGRIEEVTGTGRDVKAVIEFDDAAVGKKTIKLAYTTLEKGSA
jgi:DNA helicase-2/ATP-dependent DNA helicase PcrA